MNSKFALIIISRKFDVYVLFSVGLLSWNALDCHVDLEEELNNLTNNGPEGEAARHGNYSSIFPVHFLSTSTVVV